MIRAQSLKKSGLISILLAAIGKILSFATTLSVAYIFGANTQTDLIFFLYSLVILLSGLWTHFNSNIMLPFLVDEFNDNPTLAWQKCCYIATKVLISMAILIPIVGFFYPQIIALISRWNPEAIQSSYDFFLILIILLPVIYLNDLFCIVYQSQRHFTFTYLNSLCFGLICLISIYSLSDKWGEYSLVFGMTLAGLIQLFIMLTLLFRTGLKFSLQFKSFNLTKIDWKTWLASLALFGTQFLLIFLPDYFATGLQQGSFTSILNGRKVVEIITTLVMFPVILIFYPRMVEWHKSPDSGHKLQLVVKFLIWLCIPLICLMTLLGPLLIEYFFHNGSYTKAHTLISKMSLLTLTPGIFFISLFSLTTRWILAQKSSSILIRFCLMLALSAFISLPIFNLMTTRFQEQGLLWSQLTLQIFGYGGVSLIFLRQTKGFLIVRLIKDFGFIACLFVPLTLVLFITGLSATSTILSAVILVFIIIFNFRKISKLSDDLAIVDCIEAN